MNWDPVAGNWKQFKGHVKEKWGKLTDDGLDVIEGKQDRLVGRLQERYGYSKEQAEKECKSWEYNNRIIIRRPLSSVHMRRGGTCRLEKNFRTVSRPAKSG